MTPRDVVLAVVSLVPNGGCAETQLVAMTGRPNPEPVNQAAVGGR
jgi:hypothetical protein